MNEYKLTTIFNKKFTIDHNTRIFINTFSNKTKI